MKLLKKIIAWYQLKQADRLYAENDYLDAYQKHTDMRVNFDPHSAIGGEGIGIFWGNYNLIFL